MAFGNQEKDYAAPASTGFGSMPPTNSPGKILEKTAAESPLSAICPKCGRNSVEDVDASAADAFGQKPKCRNPNCGWEGKAQLI